MSQVETVSNRLLSDKKIVSYSVTIKLSVEPLDAVYKMTDIAQLEFIRKRLPGNSRPWRCFHAELGFFVVHQILRRSLLIFALSIAHEKVD